MSDRECIDLITLCALRTRWDLIHRQMPAPFLDKDMVGFKSPLGGQVPNIIEQLEDSLLLHKIVIVKLR